MKQHFSEEGFGGLELLIVLATVLILAGIGAYLYGKHSPAKTAKQTIGSGVSTSTGTSTTPGGIPVTATTPKPATTASQTIVKVNEAGLQIAVPNSLKDLTYHVISNSNGVITLAFSTKTISAAVPACAASQGNGAFDTIIRGDGNYPGPANPSSGGLLKQYKTYYLAYNLPNAPCAKGLSVANQNLLDDQAQDFYSVLASVQAN
jgi:uncharacterized protein (UPF0333 family)